MTSGTPSETTNFTRSQQAMVDVWDEHMRAEFETGSVDDALETMVDEPYVYLVPLLAGGDGQDGVEAFYSELIPQQAPDTEVIPVSRTVGDNQIVDEVIVEFTHTVEMDWMLPGISPTGNHVEIPLVVVVQFKDDKIAFEHIYWDQASLLVQVGLLGDETLPVTGIESTQMLVDQTTPPTGDQ